MFRRRKQNNEKPRAVKSKNRGVSAPATLESDGEAGVLWYKKPQSAPQHTPAHPEERSPYSSAPLQQRQHHVTARPNEQTRRTNNHSALYQSHRHSSAAPRTHIPIHNMTNTDPLARFRSVPHSEDDTAGERRRRQPAPKPQEWVSYSSTTAEILARIASGDDWNTCTRLLEEYPACAAQKDAVHLQGVPTVAYPLHAALCKKPPVSNGCCNGVLPTELTFHPNKILFQSFPSVRSLWKYFLELSSYRMINAVVMPYIGLACPELLLPSCTYLSKGIQKHAK